MFVGLFCRTTCRLRMKATTTYIRPTGLGIERGYVMKIKTMLYSVLDGDSVKPGIDLSTLGKVPCT